MYSYVRTCDYATENIAHDDSYLTPSIVRMIKIYDYGGLTRLRGIETTWFARKIYTIVWNFLTAFPSCKLYETRRFYLPRNSLFREAR